MTAADDRAPATGRRGRSRTDVVYEHLREQLMNGRYAPRSRLREDAIAHELQVSRTPVRTALFMLRADGLIDNDEYGYRVVLPDLHHLAELYELRVTIEMRGVQRTVERELAGYDFALLGAELDRWRELRRSPPSPTPQFVMDDERFHVTLCRAAGNEALVEALESVNHRIRAVRMYDYVTEDRITATIDEHLAIGDLVVAGHLEQAKTALGEHIGESMDTVMARATRAITNMVTRGVL
ncbi:MULTISPECIES: GntR family transcriptional regulator [unclassified Curtobacterium]|uniref:GntR family transcriptional regulator n=1 Tax=unclassified Curtobacterium TaxID=257496 RepID=UPI000826938A|nr:MULTISPECIES: GntR family transcriptional regulator [unclassified Curtobacterium]WIA98216.1 GntR family transcriptional regulator [Curtobacterium sp. MCBA15_004]WIB01470.1 GntR family transcriptional regulator [Curtobacterium sp. MCBA15_012]